jgi:hypothetical protein
MAALMLLTSVLFEVFFSQSVPPSIEDVLCGVGGWREQQLPDGTLIVTAPTGHTYLTKPGSVQLFPTLCQPTATLWAPGEEPTVPPSDGRGLMMPRRRRTRAENLARRIEAERKLNDEYVAERNRPPPF